MSKPIVLFVEDDPDDVLLTLMAMGDALKGYEVVVAKDGVEALDFLLGTGAYEGRDPSVRPALIILDLNLPRVNGTQVLERLNEAWGPELHGVPVAVLSSSYAEDERIRVREMGCRLHMRKPLRRAETDAMVTALLALLR